MMAVQMQCRQEHFLPGQQTASLEEGEPPSSLNHCPLPALTQCVWHPRGPRWGLGSAVDSRAGNRLS